MKELLKIINEITDDMKFIPNIGRDIDISIVQEEKSIVIRISLSNVNDMEYSQNPVNIEELNIQLSHLLEARRTLESILEPGKAVPYKSIENKQSDMKKNFIDELVSILEEHMENTEFNVAMLCQLLGMNKKQLYRKVRQLTGTTPVNLIRRARMTKAALLLLHGEFTVSEVMYRVGYSNPSYFSKCFMTEYKVTPSQYAVGRNKKLIAEKG